MKIKKLLENIKDYIKNTNEKVIDLEKVCYELFKNNTNLSELEILEKVEVLLPKIKKKLQEYRSSFVDRGLTPPFDFNEFEPYQLIVSEERRNWLSKKKELSKKLRKIDWKELQKICEKLLRIWGCKKTFTFFSKDGGIDVFGILYFPKNSSYFRIFRGIRIIGQVKRKKVTESDIHIFLSQINCIKKGEGRGYKKLPEWFKDSNFPWHFIFITNGSYTNDAKKLAKKEGIILIEGDELIEEIIKYYTDFQKIL